MKINIKALALTLGLVWGVGLFLFTWWVIAFDGETGEATFFLSKIYRGYEISPMGSIVGLAWGFVDGMIGGVLIGFLYNFFTEKFNSKKE